MFLEKIKENHILTQKMQVMGRMVLKKNIEVKVDEKNF
tara:strand:- start:191 stop:304 length:114 start_codon:yes stop_codon:yes gene_type:complete